MQQNQEITEPQKNIPLSIKDNERLMVFFNEDTINTVNNKTNDLNMKSIEFDIDQSMKIDENGQSKSIDIAKSYLAESAEVFHKSINEMLEKPQVVELVSIVQSQKKDSEEALLALKDIQFNGSLSKQFESLRDNYYNYKSDIMLYNIIHGELINNSDFSNEKKDYLNNERKNTVNETLADGLEKLDRISLVDSMTSQKSLSLDLSQAVNYKPESNTKNSDNEATKTADVTYSPNR